MTKTKNKTINTKATIAAPPGAGIVVVRLEDGNLFVVSTELAGKLSEGLAQFADLSAQPIPVPEWPR